MQINDIFSEAIREVDLLVLLYDTLLTKSQRSVRPEWEKRFFKAKLINWRQKDGLWKSVGENLLIVGNEKVGFSHNAFSAKSLSILLKYALVITMAAIDKVLHEAISKHFSSLAISGKLDDFVEMDLSVCYRIAHSARVRKGKGGTVKSRPGHKIKQQVLQQIYTKSFLSANQIEKICSACNKKGIFSLYAKYLNDGTSYDDLKMKWNKMYQRRNSIVHECSIVRKAKARVIDFHALNPKKIKAKIDFAKKFGRFIASELENL